MNELNCNWDSGDEFACKDNWGGKGNRLGYGMAYTLWKVSFTTGLLAKGKSLWCCWFNVARVDEWTDGWIERERKGVGGMDFFYLAWGGLGMDGWINGWVFSRFALTN